MCNIEQIIKEINFVCENNIVLKESSVRKTDNYFLFKINNSYIYAITHKTYKNCKFFCINYELIDNI